MIDYAAFRGLFRHRIRTAVNWRVLDREQPTVTIEPVTSYQRVGSLRLPWWTDAEGQFVGYDDQEATRVRVRDAVARLNELTGNHARAILGLAAAFEDTAPGIIVAPAVWLGRRRRLLLDGSHRACALYLTTPPDGAVPLLLATIRPANPAGVFDA